MSRANSMENLKEKNLKEKSGGPGRYGYELILNLYNCDPETIKSRKKLAEYVKLLCKVIKMKRYGPTKLEHFGHSNPHTSGFSFFQFIETSSIVGHFSELWNSAYINIFSCKEFDEKKALEFSKNFFKARKVKSWFLVR